MSMYKNISKAHALLILPLFACPALLSSEGNNNNQRPFNPMEQSLYIAAPTEEGRDFFGHVNNIFCNTEDNVIDYLVKKTFKPNNVMDCADLNVAVTNLIKTNQPVKLATLLAAGKANYAGEIKINDDQAIAAHNFLAQHTKQHMSSMQHKIESETKLPLDTLTKEVNGLTKSVAAHLVIIRQQLTPNVETSNTTVEANGDHIRTIQTALLNLRFVSNLKGKNGKLEGSVELDENAINTNYSNEKIAEKIKKSYSETRKETNIINKINRQIKEIEDRLAELNATMQVMNESK